MAQVFDRQTLSCGHRSWFRDEHIIQTSLMWHCPELVGILQEEMTFHCSHEAGWQAVRPKGAGDYPDPMKANSFARMKERRERD